MSTASHPAQLSVSSAAFRRALPRPHPLIRLLTRFVHIPLASEIYDEDIFEPLLRDGDARAAVVVETVPPTVAAYSDEFDAVILLRIPPAQATHYNLRDGQRLIAVFNYLRGLSSPRDIQFGPHALGDTFRNVEPLIGDLLSDDTARLNQLRAEIPDEEWARAEELGRDRLRTRPNLFRWHQPGSTQTIAGDLPKMILAGVVFVVLLVVALWQLA